jgi:hypothetical protein
MRPDEERRRLYFFDLRNPHHKPWRVLHRLLANNLPNPYDAIRRTCRARAAGEVTTSPQPERNGGWHSHLYRDIATPKRCIRRAR